MLIDLPQVYSKPLEGGLSLHTLASSDDVERLAEFNAKVHRQDEVGPLTRRLLLRHPEMEPLDQVMVENEEGEIVSALCLIPCTWELEGVALRVGELGIVGTSEAYRRRGLIREQVRYFKQRLAERGCVLSSIQGIPYFYRQFGYQYVLPLEGGYRWELRFVPEPMVNHCTIREATITDLPALMALYEEATAGLGLRTLRSEAVWRHLLENDDLADGTYHETYVAEEEGRVVGYVRVPVYHFGEELTIDEASRLRIGPAIELMAHLKKLAQEAREPGIRLSLPASSDLVRIALAHDAYSYGNYGWQIHIPDAAALLSALAPVLERRMASSPFAGWTGRVDFGLYDRTLGLHWEGGRLCSVEWMPHALEFAHFQMPQAALAPLVLGERSVEEMHRLFPDLRAYGRFRLMLDVLFPKFESFLNLAY